MLVHDVLVIGGGVVGLAVLRASTLAGYCNCVVLEQQDDLLHWASGSNSGILCTGVDASGLERALIRDSIAEWRIFARHMNLPLRSCGSLVCQWRRTEADDDTRLEEVLQESHEAGDTHAQYWTGSRVLEEEPHLNPEVVGAVHIPGEIVVDPWLSSIAFAVHARENGATIETNAQVTKAEWDGSVWTIETSHGKKYQAKVVVSATGLWSDLVEREAAGSEPLFESRPRRGQYRIFAPSTPNLLKHPIQPVPTQFTKGVFVFSTLYDQVVVGPTALDQESRTDRSVDDNVAETLEATGQHVLPDLDNPMAHYVGIRPGTDHRDYQIRTHRSQPWITVAGIRSTGLTASLGIGRYVMHRIQDLLPFPKERPTIRTTPLPNVNELVDDFHRRGDGTVAIEGHTYRVTHPLTRVGWEARTGLAAANPS